MLLGAFNGMGLAVLREAFFFFGLGWGGISVRV